MASRKLSLSTLKYKRSIYLFSKMDPHFNIFLVSWANGMFLKQYFEYLNQTKQQSQRNILYKKACLQGPSAAQ